MDYFSDQIYWYDKLDLGQVHLVSVSDQITPFPPDLEQKRVEIWKWWQSEHPSSYDGRLVRYIDHSYTNGNIQITCDLIRYSQMLTVLKYDLQAPSWTGQLGIALAVYDSSRNYILVGQRSSNNPYRPLYYCLIGGIIEQIDLQGDLVECCLRELHEEVDLSFNQPEMELVGIIDNLEGVGVQLVINVYTDVDVSSEFETNEEWKDGSLKWYHLTSLQHLRKKRMLNGLKFYLSHVVS